MSRILVTGGAGYVGSHVVRHLVERGRDVLILDNLSTGHRRAVRGVELVHGDFADPTLLDRLLGDGSIGCIVHMAASCEVGASMQDPAGYYRNNVTRSLYLLEQAQRHSVPGFVFSSSAAVYGEPRDVPIDEQHPLQPTNPYGETKLVFERALAWYASAYGLRYAALRYFNAAGAHPDGETGEDHASESHLIPRLLLSLLRDGPATPILGRDYPTEDGTCIRDYVHVLDLARAHEQALVAVESGTSCPGALNLGCGTGYSVQQLVETVESVTGRRPPVSDAPRRPGDPAVLVASSSRARAELGWQPRASLREIVETAWEWHRRFPGGYEDREVDTAPDPD